MTHCDACQKLAMKPLREDIPAHLQPCSSRSLLFGLLRVSTYECRRCETLWRWYLADGWAREPRTDSDHAVASVVAIVSSPKPTMLHPG